MTLPLNLSTCWNSDRHTDGMELLEECASMGFQTVELGHGTRLSLCPGIEEGVKQGIVKISSLHNFCPLPVGFLHAAPNCYEFSDPDPFRAQKAEQLTMDTIRWAGELGATHVVLHIGSTGQAKVSRKLTNLLRNGKRTSREYCQLKLAAVIEHEKRFEKIWPQIQGIITRCAEEAAKSGIRLGLECRESIEEIPLDHLWDRIFSELPPNVGYWHDFGHAMRKEALGFIDVEASFRKRADRLFGCHVQDFQYPDHDHLPLGDGIIRFDHYWKLIPPTTPCVLELSPRVPSERVSECLIWWNQNRPE